MSPAEIYLITGAFFGAVFFLTLFGLIAYAAVKGEL